MATGCAFADCDDCIGGVNPYDITKWAYVAKPGDPSSVAFCNTPHKGDPYLGIVGNECQCSKPAPTPPKMNGVDYIRYAEDCPPFADGCLGEEPCSFGHCTATGKDYSNCGLLTGCPVWDPRYHYWWVRNWGTELNTYPKRMACCTMDPSQPDRTKYCPPNIWFPTGWCSEVAKSYCNPFPSSNGSWVVPHAKTSLCDTYMTQNLTSAEGRPENAGSLFSYAMENWADHVDASGKPVDASDPFIDVALKWCNHNQIRGTCTLPLERVCAKVTKKDLDNDTTGQLVKLCACYLPTEESLLPGVIPRECDSLCQISSSTGGIPLYEFNPVAGTVDQKTCTQNTCVIDDVTINYVNSHVKGGTDFEQFCGCPKGGHCTCVMDGVDINVVNSIIKGGVVLNQKCSVCSDHSSHGAQAVDCKTGKPPPAPSPGPSPSPPPTPPTPPPVPGGGGSPGESWWSQHGYELVGVLVLLVLLIGVFVAMRYA